MATQKIVNPADLFDDEAPGAQAQRPVPEAELTPEQRRIRQLEDQLAKVEGKKDREGELVFPEENDENIVIHFLEDGFTALGVIWMRGQELEFTPGSQAYEDTKDRNGKSWLDYRNDEFGQVDKFGKIMFRSGLWPGKSYRDGKFETLGSLSKDGSFVPPPSEDELTAADNAARARKRAAPSFPKM